METELYIRIILDVLILVLGIIFIVWKSYFKEKGKNIATKEDIEEITSKIENIKNEVSVLSQRKLEYLTSKRNSILNLFDKVNVWIDFTLNPMDRLYNNTLDLPLLNEIVLDLKNKATEATSCYYRIAVYYESDAVLDATDNLYNACIELHNKTLQFTISIQSKAILIDDKNQRIAMTKNSEYGLKLKDEIEVIHNEVNELIEKYTIDRKNISKEVEDKRYDFIALLNIVLKVKLGKKAHNKS